MKRGFSLVELVISVALIGIIAAIVSHFSTGNIRTESATLSLEAATGELKNLMLRIEKQYIEHRAYEASTTIAPCGVTQNLLNYLRHPADDCTATPPTAAEMDATTLASVSPSSAAGLAMDETLRQDKSAKVVLESIPATTGNTLRREYEVVCVDTSAANHPWRQLDFSDASKYPIDGGCFETSFCPIGTDRSMAVLMREHKDWDDSDDLDGAYDWTAANPDDIRTVCYPSQVFAVNSTMDGCVLKADIGSVATRPMGLAFCAWVDDPTDDNPDLLNLRAWALYRNAQKRIYSITENRKIFRKDTAAGVTITPN